MFRSYRHDFEFAKLFPQRLQNEDLLYSEMNAQEPDYIVADGKWIDRNSLRPEKLCFLRENDTQLDRQASSSPWYTSHYQVFSE
jgi:hypothetical protein